MNFEFILNVTMFAQIHKAGKLVRLLSIWVVLTFIISSFDMAAQISGVTPTKINAINHQPIDVKAWEIEPNFNFCHDKGVFGDEFRVSENAYLPSLRIAYGVSDQLEIGGFLAEDFSNYSVKYKVADGDIGIALLSGAYFPWQSTEDDRSTYALGIAASSELNSKLSMDFNFHYQRFFSRNDDLPNTQNFIFLDIGYYVKSDILLMLGIGQQVDYFDFDNANKVSLYPGFVIEKWEKQAIAINGQFDIFGKELEQIFGLAIAWTYFL